MSQMFVQGGRQQMAPAQLFRFSTETAVRLGLRVYHLNLSRNLSKISRRCFYVLLGSDFSDWVPWETTPRIIDAHIFLLNQANGYA
jgi:hypothetical protein